MRETPFSTEENLKDSFPAKTAFFVGASCMVRFVCEEYSSLRYA